MNASSASITTTPAVPPLPDDGLDYSPLPATGDDGFPQAFLLNLQGVVYRLTMAVYYADPDFVVSPAHGKEIFDLPDAARGLYLNLKAEYEEQPEATRLIGARRVVLDIP